MAGPIIKGDIVRDGFTDTDDTGTSGQVRTLNSSNQAVWATPSGSGGTTGTGLEIDGGRRVGTGGAFINMGRRV